MAKDELKYEVDNMLEIDFDQRQQTMARQFEESYRIKKHVTAAPTYKPKNFFDQFVLYDDGANRRLYLYVNNTWRYVTLT